MNKRPSDHEGMSRSDFDKETKDARSKQQDKIKAANKGEKPKEPKGKD